jgi:hypothetical protein
VIIRIVFAFDRVPSIKRTVRDPCRMIVDFDSMLLSNKGLREELLVVVPTCRLRVLCGLKSVSGIGSRCLLDHAQTRFPFGATGTPHLRGVPRRFK